MNQIELTETQYRELRGFYRDALKMYVCVFVAMLFVLAAILSTSTMGLPASSRFIYSLYVFFCCTLVATVLLVCRIVYGTLACVLIVCGKFKVCCTEKKFRHFCNISKRERCNKVGRIIYVRVLLDRYYLEMESGA